MGDEEIVSDDDFGVSSIDGSVIGDAEELPEDDEVEDDTHLRLGHKSFAGGFTNGTSKSRLAQLYGENKTKTSSSKAPSRSRLRACKSGGLEKWGSASTTAITLKDIAGERSRSTHSAGGYEGMKATRMRLQKKKIAQKERRNEVKNSLAHFLNDNNPDDESEGEEDDSLISEEEKKASVDGTSSDGDESLKSQKSSTRRRRAGRTTDERSVGSRSRSRARRRLKADNDDATVGSRGASRRRTRRVANDDMSVGSVGSMPRRRQGESQKPTVGGDASGRRRRRTAAKTEDDDDDKGTSTSADRYRQKLTNDAGHSPRSRVRRRVGVGASDDRSVGSVRSCSTGRRKPKEDPSRHSRSLSPCLKPKNGGGDSPMSRPEFKKKEQDVPKTQGQNAYQDAHDELEQKINSLAGHLESNPDARKENDPDAASASENSSRYSFRGVPPSLLQFDPSNVDNVTRVRQDEANVNKEIVKLADGTESEVQIRELAGLPTFEAPDRRHESGASGFSYESDESGSVSISDFEEPLNDDAPTSNRSNKSDGTGSYRSERTADSGDDLRSTDGSDGQDPGETTDGRQQLVDSRKLRKSRSGRLKKVRSVSFLRRRKKGKSDSKGDGEAVPDGEQRDGKSPKTERRKSFFGKRRKKKKADKGEDASHDGGESSSEDEEHKGVFRRKKKTGKNMGHMALMDDGSDDSEQ